MSTPKYLDEAFEQICKEMKQIFIDKHKDYGKGNIMSIKEMGISLRLTEKIERLKHLLASSKEPKNESLDETWIDIGVYGIIGLLYRKGWFKKLKLSTQALKDDD